MGPDRGVVWGWAAACPSGHGLAWAWALCETCRYTDAGAWLCSMEDEVMGVEESGLVGSWRWCAGGWE